MAIDTAVKRGSSIGVAVPFGRVLPFPSGTIGVVQRQFAAFGYVGIAAGAPPTFRPYFLRNANTIVYGPATPVTPVGE